MNFPVFEAMMITCFGAAWPFSIIKSYRSRTNKGKSLFFLCIVDIGYAAGIIHKIYWANDSVIWLYIINFAMVTIDIILYVRNARLDKLKSIS